MITYIEEYYQFLLKNPDKACHKVLATYKKLVQDLYNPKQVSFLEAHFSQEALTLKHLLKVAHTNAHIGIGIISIILILLE